jgi:hypothetical protein
MTDDKDAIIADLTQKLEWVRHCRDDAEQRLERAERGERIATASEVSALCHLFHAAYCDHVVPESAEDLPRFTGEAERQFTRLALEILGITL